MQVPPVGQSRYHQLQLHHGGDGEEQHVGEDPEFVGKFLKLQWFQVSSCAVIFVLCLCVSCVFLYGLQLTLLLVF